MIGLHVEADVRVRLAEARDRGGRGVKARDRQDGNADVAGIAVA